MREIARVLSLSRNTVRRILRSAAPAVQIPDEPTAAQAGALVLRAPPGALPREVYETLFARAQGNVVRMLQLLKSEYGKDVSYSTFTRWVRQAGLRPQKTQRCGEYVYDPGIEMQHDTSPHRFEIGGRSVKAQCASLILGHSRRLYMQYYPRFTRLEAKHFLLEGVRFMEGSADRCVIDNTSVILAGGAGADAIVAPEMEAFARTLGFGFLAHEIMHSDRKGKIERPFFWIETNFLPGRTFQDFDDVNGQALEWCRTIANAKPKVALQRQVPEVVYLAEKPYLNALPSALPPIYEVLERCVDLQGFVSVDTNRYSVPERLTGQSVSIYQYPGKLKIFHRRQLIATHKPLIGCRDAKQVLPQHHSVLTRVRGRARPQEPRLNGIHPLLDRYVKELLKAGSGARPSQPRRALKRLLEIERTYPQSALLGALEQALRFRLYDLGRLEALILKHVSGDFFALPKPDSEDEES